MTARHLVPLALALCLAFAAPASADDLTPAKAADIQLLLKVSGSSDVGKQLSEIMTNEIIGALRRQQPNILPQNLAIIEREILALMLEKFNGPGGILDKLTPVYAATFTHGEIRDMLAFYQSPTGRKSVEATPALMREGARIGQELSQSIDGELKSRLKAALDREGVPTKKQ